MEDWQQNSDASLQPYFSHVPRVAMPNDEVAMPRNTSASAEVGWNYASNITFFARGDAADIWRVETRINIPGQPKEYLSKVLRLQSGRFGDRVSDQGYNDIWKEFIQDFRLKVLQWTSVRHRNVVRVFGLGENLDLHVEFCGYGNPHQYLEQNNHDPRIKRLMISDILRGVEYLHTRTPPIVHGCLNANKVFVTQDGATKIGEFGLATLTRNIAVLVPSISHAGLSRWMSPELIDFDPDEGNATPTPTTASDVWAVGCTLYEIVTGELPYSKHKHELRVRREIALGKPPAYPASRINKDFSRVWHVLGLCWTLSPESRPSVSAIRQLAYLAGVSHGTHESQQTGSRFFPAAPRAWDLYLSDKSNELVKATPSISLADLFKAVFSMWASEDSEIRAQYSLMAENLSFARHRGPLSHYPLYDVDVESIFESTAPVDSSGPVSNIWSRRKAKDDKCDNCRRLLMKCVFQLGTERCKRCQDTGKTCSKAGGPGNPYRSRGLATQVEDKNRLIDSLLSLVNSPRRDTQPPNIVETQQRPEHSPALVMPDTQNQEAPRDWGQGISILDKLKALFLAFINDLNVNIAIIDPCLHTFDGLRQQSPFLMTVICAVASRFSIDDEAFYSTLMSQARALTAKAVRDGWKSLEDCQAYLLLSLYPLPAVNRTEDRSWYFLGCAISMALDLRLYDQGPARFTDEIKERKQLVRTRIWLMCFNMDRGLATKLGRPTTMFENHAVKYSLNWCWHSQYNDRQDLRLCLRTQLLRTVTKYLRDIYSDPESPNTFNKNVDFRHITSTFDIEMEAFRNVIAQHCANAPERDHPASLFRLSLLSLEIEYHRMVLYSFGLQRLNDSNLELSSTFLAQSVDAATEVLRIAAEDLTTYDLVQYSPDEHWRWPAFAAVLMIKLAIPHASTPHHTTMAPAERDHSLLLVQKLIDAFERSSADTQHAPARYARFLRRIIKERNGNSAEEKGGTTAETSGEEMEDILEGIYSLDGNFWENALAPGTWGILSEG